MLSPLLTSQGTRPLRSLCRVSLAGRIPRERGDPPPAGPWRTWDEKEPPEDSDAGQGHEGPCWCCFPRWASREGRIS